MQVVNKNYERIIQEALSSSNRDDYNNILHQQTNFRVSDVMETKNIGRQKSYKNEVENEKIIDISQDQ